MSVMFRIFLIAQLVFAERACADSEGSSQIGADAVAPPICILSPSMRTVTGQNMTLQSLGDGKSGITITEMVDNATATLKPAGMELSLHVVCNVSHQITITSTRGALVPQEQVVATTGDFLKEIKYRATARWGGQTIVLLANNPAGPRAETRNIAGARTGDFSLEIRMDAADNDLTVPVLATTYSDVFRIEIGARL